MKLRLKTLPHTLTPVRVVDGPPTGIALAMCLIVGALCIASVTASEGTKPTGRNGVATDFPQRIKNDHLPNLIEVHTGVFSGGAPDGERGFLELKELGFKTVISVDGMKPNVVTAKQLGLKYIHLPHGYDGISPDRIQDLAKALLVAPRPIYVHCHHGKHRSPAATAAAALTSGMISRSIASRTLELAGTNPDFQGLFRSVQSAVPVDHQTLLSLPTQFQEVSPVPKLARRMVEIQATVDRLHEIQVDHWSISSSQPDLALRHQATLLEEHFRELIRTADEDAAVLRLKPQLTESLDLVIEFRKRSLSQDGSNSDHRSLDRSFRNVMSNCKECHRRYRD